MKVGQLKMGRVGAWRVGSATAREAIDVEKYQGVWYEVASLKRGFAGEGQLDCHCTQGLYSKTDQGKMSVKTFCVHGSSTGKISGIEGRVSCESAAGDAEGEGFQGCRLNFPSIPFIPPEPYNVLDTDYTNASFVQVYSRKPQPGKAFVRRMIGRLEKDYGYEKGSIKETPQDCDENLMQKMDAMMRSPGMTSMMSNTAEKTIDELLGGDDDFDGIALQGPRNPLTEAKDLLDLFRMF
ncbi:calycin [Chloropicon primus]|nr:calycin [Chloropicon primus]